MPYVSTYKKCIEQYSSETQRVEWQLSEAGGEEWGVGVLWVEF
jgi:hypothetical protein